MQNVVKMVLSTQDKNEQNFVSKNSEENETEEADFESPFADREEEFIYKPVKFKFDSSISNGANVNGE